MDGDLIPKVLATRLLVTGAGAIYFIWKYRNAMIADLKDFLAVLRSGGRG